MKRHISSIIRISVSVVLLCLLVYYMRDKFGDFLNILKGADLNLILAAIGMYFVDIAIITLRLKILMASEKINVPFFRLLELNFIGFFFNNFMPSAIGGDIVKAYYAGQVTGSKARSYVSVFMDRVTGLFSFAIVGFIALLIGWKVVDNPAIRYSVMAFVLGCLGVAVVTLNTTAARFVTFLLSKVHFKRLGETLQKAYDMLHAYKDKKGIVFMSIVISLMSQSLYFVIVYLIFQALGHPVPFAAVIVLMPVVCVVSMLPSLGGLGLREGAIVVLFGAMAGKEVSLGVSVVLFGILALLSMIGGVIYLLSPQFRGMKLAQEGCAA